MQRRATGNGRPCEARRNARRRQSARDVRSHPGYATVAMMVMRLLGRGLLAVRSASVELAAETLAVKGGERAGAGNAGDNPATRAARKGSGELILCSRNIPLCSRNVQGARPTGGRCPLAPAAAQTIISARYPSPTDRCRSAAWAPRPARSPENKNKQYRTALGVKPRRLSKKLWPSFSGPRQMCRGGLTGKMIPTAATQQGAAVKALLAFSAETNVWRRLTSAARGLSD